MECCSGVCPYLVLGCWQLFLRTLCLPPGGTLCSPLGSWWGSEVLSFGGLLPWDTLCVQSTLRVQRPFVQGLVPPDLPQSLGG